MFTVKVIRRDKEGRERVHLYEAISVNAFPEGGNDQDSPHVVLNQPNGEQPWIQVGDWDSEFPCVAIYVENANGKTSEVIRANKERKSVTISRK